MIPFSIPTFLGSEFSQLHQTLSAHQKLSGDGEYTRLATEKLVEITDCSHILLTGSCSHALEMAAMLLDLKPGDEVIMPSYTFVSTANAFVLQGAVPVFVDIRPETMNIDERLIESAITDKTRVICVMHYGGIACAMNKIMQMANQYDLVVIEDAAQGINAYYHTRGVIEDIWERLAHSVLSVFMILKISLQEGRVEPYWSMMNGTGKERELFVKRVPTAPSFTKG